MYDELLEKVIGKVSIQQFKQKFTEKTSLIKSDLFQYKENGTIYLNYKKQLAENLKHGAILSQPSEEEHAIKPVRHVAVPLLQG